MNGSPRSRRGARLLLVLGLACAGPAQPAQDPVPPPAGQPTWSRYMCLGLKDGSVLVYTWWEVTRPAQPGSRGKAAARLSGNAWCFTPKHALIGQQPRSVPLDSVRYAMTDTPERLPGVPTLRPKNQTALATGLTVLGGTWLILMIVVTLTFISLIVGIAGVGY